MNTENDLLYDTQIWQKLMKFYNANEIPHLLFYGTSGNIKKNIIKQFIRVIYQNNQLYINDNVMFVNCLHGKGIKFIREELKLFARQNIQSHNNTSISFKSIVLLHADYLTVDAQSALRRCIEQYSYNTRFFMIVEHKNKLLIPILSRFCEIYVQPETSFLQKIEEIRTDKNSIVIVNELTSLFAKWNIGKHSTKEQLVEFTNYLYNDGISSYDLISYIQNLTPVPIHVIIYFYKIKSEYRNERLLMTCLLSQLYYGNDERLFSLNSCL